MIPVIKLEYIALIIPEKMMIEENIFGNQGFAGSRFPGGFIQQDKLIDHDTNIAGENKIRDGRK
jgi:hypothetical protein